MIRKELASPTQQPVLLQRQCAACAGRRHHDEADRKRRLFAEGLLHRQERPGIQTETVPPVVGEVLREPGRPLDVTPRSFFEPRFDRDFSKVRVHTGNRAAESAEAVGALAYTVGNNLVFGRGQYQPGTDAGRRLLAHELTHTLQQRGEVHAKLALGPINDRFEQEADRVVESLLDTPPYGGVSASVPGVLRPSVGAVPKVIQRRLVVENPNSALPGAPPRTAREDVRDYIHDLSSSFGVDATGVVAPSTAAHCTSTSRFTDRCLCDLHQSTNPVPWKIKIDDIAWPHTEEANRRVSVHSTRSVVEFGAWGGGAQAGQRIFQSNARVLGHELCGHAWLMELRIHPPFIPSTRGGRLMGRPSHDVTVMIENRVAQDMFGVGADQRGTFSDPHHGESFARITVSEFPTNSTSVSALPANMQTRLTRITAAMAAQPLIRADVFGHADRTGSAAANANVSRRRALAVRNHLTRQGISASRFRVVRGKSVSECPPPAGANSSCRKAEVFMFVFEGASERYP